MGFSRRDAPVHGCALGHGDLLVVPFAPYSWLYATPLYLIMGAAVALGVTAAMGLNVRTDLPKERRATIRSGRVSLITGLVLVVGSGVAWFLEVMSRLHVRSDRGA